MRTYCIAQGTLLNALQGPRWEGNLKKRIIGIHLTDSLCCTPKANMTLSNNHVCMHAQLLQSCMTLWDFMDCRPPGSFVHGILQARILEWVPFLPPGDLPNPGIKPMSLMSPALAGGSSYQHYSSPNSRRIPYTHRQFQHP